MSEKEIIERLEKIAKHAVYVFGEEPFFMSLDDGIAIHEAIDILKNKDVPHWIPCSERLPEYGRYLVSCSWSIFSPMVMNYDPDDDGWFYDGCKSAGYEVPTINAWMPLPEPYGEDCENDDGI